MTALSSVETALLAIGILAFGSYLGIEHWRRKRAERLRERAVRRAVVSHTPGPWGFIGRSVFDTRRVRVAVAEWRGVGGTAIGESNACLIAAAPELLEALKSIMKADILNGSQEIAARGLIAKAEGRS